MVEKLFLQPCGFDTIADTEGLLDSHLTAANPANQHLLDTCVKLLKVKLKECKKLGELDHRRNKWKPICYAVQFSHGCTEELTPDGLIKVGGIGESTVTSIKLEVSKDHSASKSIVNVQSKKHDLATSYQKLSHFQNRVLSMTSPPPSTQVLLASPLPSSIIHHPISALARSGVANDAQVLSAAPASAIIQRHSSTLASSNGPPAALASPSQSSIIQHQLSAIALSSIAKDSRAPSASLPPSSIIQHPSSSFASSSVSNHPRATLSSPSLSSIIQHPISTFARSSIANDQQASKVAGDPQTLELGMPFFESPTLPAPPVPYNNTNNRYDEAKQSNW